jgi:hypothetical protein
MMASKAPEAALLGREARSAVEEARRSVAEGPPADVDWTCEAEKSLSLRQLPRDGCLFLAWEVVDQ